MSLFGGTIEYVYCDACAGAEQAVDVTIGNYGCVVVQDGYSGSEYVYSDQVTFKATIPAPINCDLTVWWRVDYNNQFSSIGGGYEINNSYYESAVIPAGQTGTSWITRDCNYDVTAVEFTDLNSYVYTFVAQQSLPSCEEGIGCTLEITGSTVSGTTFLGTSDGAVEVFISGATGSSYTFRLNGGTPQSSATFTGLAAGTYQIRVDEGNCYSVVNITITSGAFSTNDFNVIDPIGIVASENPITITLQTAGNDPTSLPSISTFTVAQKPENNYRVRFNLTSPIDYDKSFYARDFPVRDSYFLSDELRNKQGDYIADNSIDNIAISFAESLERDIIISNNYYINQTGATITLIAKENSSRYDLTSANVEFYNAAGTPVTTGITLTQVQAGTDRYEGSLLTDYQLYVEVYIEPDGEYGDTSLTSSGFRRISEVSLPYNKTNLNTFDVSGILKNFVYAFKPDLEATGFTINTNYIRPFLLKYGEKFPLIANEPTSRKREKAATSIKYVCNAALDFEAANDMSYYTGNTLSGGTIIEVPFLTTSPTVKHSNRSQRELINFLIPKNLGTDISVYGNITFWDGTTLLNQKLLDIVPTGGSLVNFGGQFIVNVSFEKLGLDDIQTTYNKLIRQVDYVIKTYNGTIEYSNVKSFYYELEEPQNRFGVMFLNKLGTYDTFDFAGIQEETISRTAKNYTVARPINFDGSSPEGFKNKATYDTMVTKKITVNSGWINIQHYDWLIELMASNDIYSYTSGYDNYLNVEGFKYVKSNNDNVYSLEITFIQTIFENSITI